MTKEEIEEKIKMHEGKLTILHTLFENTIYLLEKHNENIKILTECIKGLSHLSSVNEEYRKFISESISKISL